MPSKDEVLLKTDNCEVLEAEWRIYYRKYMKLIIDFLQLSNRLLEPWSEKEINRAINENFIFQEKTRIFEGEDLQK